MPFFKYLMLLVLTSVAFPTYSQTTEGGKLVYVGPYEQDKIKNLFEAYQVPLIVISNRVYYPSIPCVDPRGVDGDTESRNIAGNIEDRDIAGDLENRRLGGDIENRNLEGDGEVRQVQGRLEERSLGGHTEDREVKGDLEGRSLGGDIENRSIGGDGEERQLGGDSENRGVDGSLETRVLGGDMAEIECYRLEGRIGFELKKLNQNASVLLYNNFELTEIRDFIVEY